MKSGEKEAEMLSSPQDIANLLTILVGNAEKLTERGSVDVTVWSSADKR